MKISDFFFYKLVQFLILFFSLTFISGESEEGYFFIFVFLIVSFILSLIFFLILKYLIRNIFYLLISSDLISLIVIRVLIKESFGLMESLVLIISIVLPIIILFYYKKSFD